MLHLDGTDASTPANGDNSVVRFGKSSVYLDGNSDYLTFVDSPDWCFGANDFTIDFWVRFNSLSTLDYTIYEQFVDTNNYIRFVIGYVSAGNYYLRMKAKSGGSWILDYDGTSTAWVTGMWYHVAIVRNGNTFYFFKDGVSIGSTIDTDAVPDFVAGIRIGMSQVDSNYLNGWIDEIRISKGVARWNADFTPPTKNYGLTGDTNIEYKAIAKIVSDSGSSNNYYFQPNYDDGTLVGRQQFYGSSTSYAAARATGLPHFFGSTTASPNYLMGEILYHVKSGYPRTSLIRSMYDISGTTVGVVYMAGNSYNETAVPITFFRVSCSNAGGIGRASQLELYARRITA
jgi:hypothetical protein